ncbi:MAG: hypothetical protein ACTSYL_00090 [Candidatus Thorarchaeota archaeon]
MVDLIFGDLTATDAIMAILTGILGGIMLGIAYKMAEKGIPHWIPRKLVHVSMGSIIGLTIVAYSNLSGPTFAIGTFLTFILYAWAHKSTLVSELLAAGSREGESRVNTFVSGFMGMIAFAIAFLMFLSQPAIFVTAILGVAWADAAGEAVGRTWGGRFVHRIGAKSFEGSCGVYVLSVLSQVTALSLYSSICILCVIPQLLIIAGLMTLTEAISKRWLDNFLIPLVTAFAMWLLLFPNMPLFFAV